MRALPCAKRLALPGFFYWLFFTPSSAARDRQAAKARYDCHIEARIVPPPGIVHFIDSDFAIENADNQRYRSNPAMPDPCEEVCRPIYRIFPVARQAGRKKKQSAEGNQNSYDLWTHRQPPWFRILASKMYRFHAPLRLLYLFLPEVSAFRYFIAPLCGLHGYLHREHRPCLGHREQSAKDN